MIDRILRFSLEQRLLVVFATLFLVGAGLWDMNVVPVAAGGGLPPLQEVRSLSKIGLSVITVVFEDGVDISFARQQAFERLQQARERLPKGIEPQLGAFTPGPGET